MGSTTDEINELMNKYWSWLKNNTITREIDSNWVEITTPYLDRHNDHYQLYVSKRGKRYIITDDGYTVSDLALSGLEITKGKRKAWFDTIINSYGIEVNKNSLVVYATEEDFSSKKHDLIQAMQSISGLFYTSKTVVKGLFFEDVSEWLHLCNIPHNSNISLKGSNYSYHVDFIFPEKNAYEPKRILQLINYPKKTDVANLLMMKSDLKEKTDIYVMINDQESSGKQVETVYSAIQNFGMNPILWSKRSESITPLS